MNDLTKCGEACNCTKCRVASYFDQRKEPAYVPTLAEVDQAIADAVAMNENMRTFGCIDVPAPIKFHELDDGAHFMLAIPYTYGSRRVYVKAIEDGELYTAVSIHNSSIGIGVDHNTLVIPIKE